MLNKIMRKKTILGIIAGLILFEILFTIYLLSVSRDDSFLCDFKSSCSVVQNSVYGEIFGFKVSWLGLMGFVALLYFYFLALTEKRARVFYFLLSFIGAIFAFYFIYLQFFVLKTICKICLIIDVTMIIIFVFSYFWFKKFKTANFF